jgi:hypothetical protein
MNKKYAVVILAVVAIFVCNLAFAGLSESVFERNRPSEQKGWTIYSSDTDIDSATPELVTGLATTYAQLAAEDKVEVLSASGDTTQLVTIHGINSAGKKKSETITLTGTTAATSDTTWRYISQADLNAPCEGLITVRRGTGNTFITSIATGELTALMAQHFNGEYFSYITNWKAAVHATPDTITFELREYPSAASSLSESTGYKVLDSMTISGAGSDESYYCQPIKVSAGSWIAVFGQGKADDSSGSVLIQGVDLKQ